MNRTGVVLWGLVSTIVMTTTMAGSQALRLTRMNVPYMLGTMVTDDRDRATMLGLVVHVVSGLGFAAFYAAAFESWRRATWWAGAAIGVLHGAAMLLVGMRALPAVHPRMVREDEGPRATRQLEPPGWLALNYGPRTPATVMLGHVLFGAIFGACYRPSHRR